SPPATASASSTACSPTSTSPNPPSSCSSPPSRARRRSGRSGLQASQIALNRIVPAPASTPSSPPTTTPSASVTASTPTATACCSSDPLGAHFQPGIAWFIPISSGFSTFQSLFHFPGPFPHLHPASTLSAPLLRLAPPSIAPYSQPMPSPQRFRPPIPSPRQHVSRPARSLDAAPSHPTRGNAVKPANNA